MDAEGVLRETYVKVWHWRERFDETRGPVDLWLAAMAHCSAIDSLRRGPLRSHRFTRSAVDERDPNPALALALPTDPQATLALALHDGLSHGELAAKLQRPIGTVKAWLRASLADLRHTHAEQR